MRMHTSQLVSFHFIWMCFLQGCDRISRKTADRMRQNHMKWPGLRRMHSAHKRLCVRVRARVAGADSRPFVMASLQAPHVCPCPTPVSAQLAKRFNVTANGAKSIVRSEVAYLRRQKRGVLRHFVH